MHTDVMHILERVGALITDSHIVYTSGRHGSGYVNKDALYTYPHETAQVAAQLAAAFADQPIEVVAGPSIGGVILAQWVAYHLGQQRGQVVQAVYAEEEGVTGHRVFRRGYADLLPGRTVLVVEDILTTGGSARKVLRAVDAAGGTIAGLGAICNRGGLSGDLFNVPRFVPLVTLNLTAWEAAECPLCRDGVPINTQVGKGAAFLARRTAP